MEENKKNRNDADLDDQMERDTEIRRESQVRGSLGVPPSGERSGGMGGGVSDRDEAVPEFERGTDLDRGDSDDERRSDR